MQYYHVWSGRSIYKELKKLDPQKGITVFAAEEYEIQVSYLKIKHIKNIVWIFGGVDPNRYKKYPGKVLLWHNFWMFNTLRWLKQQSYNGDVNADKIFISLNNNAHQHRCLLLDTLANHDMINEGYVSWHKKADYNFKYWNQEIMKFNDGFLETSGYDELPEEYSRALINLVSESTVNTIFITEKTYNAIFSEKPFLIQGAPRVHRYLSNLGFEMYDEIFDYSFDVIDDYATRTEMIVKNLINLKSKNLHEVKKLLSPKAKRNKERALEIIKNKKGIPNEAFLFPVYEDMVNTAVDIANNIGKK